MKSRGLILFSLLLAAVMAEEWIRSRGLNRPIRYIHTTFGTGRVYASLAMEQGLLGAEAYWAHGRYYCRTTDYGLVTVTGGRSYSDCPTASPAYSAVIMGSTHFVEASTDQLGPHVRVVLPFWIGAGFVSVLPIGILTARKWRARRHRRASICAACGYNLTGNTSGVCPECGTAIPAPARDAVAPAQPAGTPNPASHRS